MVQAIPSRALIFAVALCAVATVYLFAEQEQAYDVTEPSAACEVTVVADVLNVRSEPSTSSPVVTQVAQATTVEASRTVRNGFRQLAEDQWAADEFLSPVDADACAAE